MQATNMDLTEPITSKSVLFLDLRLIWITHTVDIGRIHVPDMSILEFQICQFSILAQILARLSYKLLTQSYFLVAFATVAVTPMEPILIHQLAVGRERSIETYVTEENEHII
jgi:hypothetical protein